MLSSGVETQPIPLDSPMSAGAQELYTELSVSISPELSVELEPSLIPDAKPEASSSLVQTLPLELQRTHVENCSQETNPMGDGEKPRGCQLSMSPASGVFEKEGETERVKQHPSNDHGDQEASTVRRPREGSAAGQEQPSLAATEGVLSSCQVDLQKQPKQDPSRSPLEDELRHTEENQGNVQVTAETLPKPTEEGQGMKVNGTKTISNAGHRTSQVSKSLPTGCIDCPDIDKIMTSGEVSETCTLVSLEPLTFVKPGLTKAPSKEKECEKSGACSPLWPPSPQDCASPSLDSGEGSSRLKPDHEAIDNHQHNCGCTTENPSKTSIPLAKKKTVGVYALEADPQVLNFPLSLPCAGSESIFLKEYGSGDNLGKPSWNGEVLKEGSASGQEGEGEVLSVWRKSREVLPAVTKPGEESNSPPLKDARIERHLPSRGCAPESCCKHNPSQGIRGCIHQENSVFPLQGDPMKVPSKIQENFKNHKGKRVTCPCDIHQDEAHIEESYSSVVQSEETEKTLPEEPSVLGKSVDTQSHESLVSSTERRNLTTYSVPEEPTMPVRKVSEVNSVSQLQTFRKCDLANQPEAKETIGIVSQNAVPFMNGQSIAFCGHSELTSSPTESSEDKGKLLCDLPGRMSFDECGHREAAVFQELYLGDYAEDLCKGTRKVSQQHAGSMLEDGDEVTANQKAILTATKNVTNAFCPGAATCYASSQNHDVSANAVSFKRVPNNTVREKTMAMSRLPLEKEGAELSEEADLEHESIQSQGCHSCLWRDKNISEGDRCSEDVTYRSTAITPNAENWSKLPSKDIQVPIDPLTTGAESSLAKSILNVRHPLGENELAREETGDHFPEDRIRNDGVSCSLLSRALSRSTLALSCVKHEDFIARSAGKVGSEEERVGTQSKETAFPCESHTSEHSILEGKLSSSIPNPKEVMDQRLNTECSNVKILNQAEETVGQVMNQGLNCQGDLNGPIECWSEKSSTNKHHSRGIIEVQHTINCKSENVTKPNKAVSSSQKELLTNDLSDVQPSCGLPKKNIFKTSLQSILGNEGSAIYRVDPGHLSNNLGEEVLEMKESVSTSNHRRQEEPSRLQLDGPSRCDQPQAEVLVSFEALINQDSILPNASDSCNMRSLETVSSCKRTSSDEQRDGGLRDAVIWKSEKSSQAPLDEEAHEPSDSITHREGPVTNHESNAHLVDTANVLPDSMHCGQIIKEMFPEETQGRAAGGLRPQTNFASDDGASLEVYSQEPVLGSAQTTLLCTSSQEDPAAGSDGPLDEKTKTEYLCESDGVKELTANLKSSTLKTKVKKGTPGGIPGTRRSGFLPYESRISGASQSQVDHGLVASSFGLNSENKMSGGETKEQHQGTLNDLKVIEESEGNTLREDGGDMTPDVYRPCLKRKRMCGETETQKAQIVQGIRCHKEGREDVQLKKGTQLGAPLNAKTSARPTVGPFSQDLTNQKHPRGSAQKQSTFPMTDDSEAGRQAHTRTESFVEGPCLPITAELPQDNSCTASEEIPGTFAITPYQRKSLPPLKKGLSWTCENITCQEHIKTGRKINVKKWILLTNASESISVKEHQVLSSSFAAPSSATRRLVPSSVRLQKSTKESALLTRLSVLARKLLAPSLATRELRSQPCSSELLPVAERYKWLRFQKLQDDFPYNSMQLNLHLGDYGCNETFSRQTLALYPLEALRVGFLDLIDKMPSLQFNAQIFPISFHINLDSELTTDATRIFSEHCSPPESTPGGDPIHPPQPPKWTYSFLMSPDSSGTATFTEDAGLTCDLPHASLQALCPGQAPGSNAIVKVRAGCSVLGLHTVLALSSPGCYRIWTRRRSLSSHLPTIQRLSMTQFTQGFKGLRLPESLSNSLFPSLPYSVGRVLSIWSQHGPSACPFEITTLHSKHSKWPPTLGIRNSHAVLPHVPQLGMEATTARTRGSPVRPGPSFSALTPKSCLAFEPVVSVLRLSASDFQLPAFKELGRVPTVCSSQHSSASQKEIEPEKRPKKVSQIRIRKTIPRPDPNLTPMGLPRPKRPKKKEFSLEEIYTNKNYKSPPASRCLETIFEEPKERNGALISVSQQKRKRVLEFQDFTVPRKRRNRGKIKVMGSFTRAKKAALQSRELDALLIQKLMDLEAFFAKEGEGEPASGC